MTTDAIEILRRWTKEDCSIDEDMIEQMYWEFDAKRKERSERDVFKESMRSFARKMHRRTMGV